MQYFDQNNGITNYAVYPGSHWMEPWAAENEIAAPKSGGHSSRRRRIRQVPGGPGEEIGVAGLSDGGWQAPLDDNEIR